MRPILVRLPVLDRQALALAPTRGNGVGNYKATEESVWDECGEDG